MYPFHDMTRAGITGRHPAGRTSDCGRLAVEDVRVDHRRADVTIAQQLLDGPDVAPVLEEVGVERVTEGMGRCALGEPQPPDDLGDRALNHGHDTDTSRDEAIASGGDRRPHPAHCARPPPSNGEGRA